MRTVRPNIPAKKGLGYGIWPLNNKHGENLTYEKLLLFHQPKAGRYNLGKNSRLFKHNPGIFVRVSFLD